ncbi:MAG: SIS domain-containing protein [Candidatus Undinarchaeales archaeon]|jgi:D-sedoheptulose 7-phosphate isomerase|nr:SIS domain-containing protein [Candidatus Undinarchaeales archaeon]
MTFEEHAKKLESLARSAFSMKNEVENAANMIKECLLGGHKVLACGNGGSASDANHFIAELVCKYKQDRKPLEGISLNANPAVMTAIANDYSYDKVFERQVEALGKTGDVLIAISTSGTSENVVKAAQKAKEIGIKTIALTGNVGTLAEECDFSVKVQNKEVPRIQEMHAFILHEICEVLE